MSALFAFLHHLAAFGLVAAIALELILINEELTIERARRLLRIDMFYGAAAGSLLVIGFIRVMWLEKGPAFYFHNAAFIAKLVLFLLVGLLSIYPTREFLSWRKVLQRGQRPFVEPSKLRGIRTVLHIELAGVVLIILCAALMARGISSFN
jgi:putative membrane protein